MKDELNNFLHLADMRRSGPLTHPFSFILCASRALIPTLVAVLLFAACTSGPEPVYVGPTGLGQFVYDPERGITRKGSAVSTDEQSLFDQVEKAHDEGRWDDCIALSLTLTFAHPEGSRAVDAILLRLLSHLEAGRNPEEGFAKSISLERWFFLYLAPVWDARIQAFRDAGGEAASELARHRNRPLGAFLVKIRPAGNSLIDTGHLAAAIEDLRILANYYLPAMEIDTYRLHAVELGRDLAWLAYAGGDYNLVIEIAADLDALNPPPPVKADMLLILGRAEAGNGAHAMAAYTFGQLFRGANLRDTDTRWRPHGLYWMILETTKKSKGPAYDIAVYEDALELLGEYELYLGENPSLSKEIRKKFERLIERTYQVMIDRAVNAANTYSKLGESGSSDYYLRSAESWKTARTKRLARVREIR